MVIPINERLLSGRKLYISQNGQLVVSHFLGNVSASGK